MERLKRLKIVVFILRKLNPNYSHCVKCGLPWNHCKAKTVMTSENGGTFATCQYCWDRSNIYELCNCFTLVYAEQKRSCERIGLKMDHTWEHLLHCVNIEYAKTHKNKALGRRCKTRLKAMSEKKPTIGRIVNYKTTEQEREWMRNSGNSNVSEVLPAMVVAVWSDTCVNLKVFCDGNVPDMWKTSAPLGENEACWSWPVY